MFSFATADHVAEKLIHTSSQSQVRSFVRSLKSVAARLKSVFGAVGADWLALAEEADHMLVRWNMRGCGGRKLVLLERNWRRR